MKLAIIRTANGPLKLNKYNIQEIGLAKALLKKGISVDLYSTFIGIEKEQIYSSHNECSLKLIPIKGVAYKQITYYPGLLNKFIKGDYNLVQVHDDSQLMNSFILSLAKKKGIKTILYQGMYKNYTGFGGVYQRICEFLFLNKLKNSADIVFSKTTKARDYLIAKGFKNIDLLPVGLDFKDSAIKFSKEQEVKNFKNKFKHILLYIGVLEKRRNVLFLLNILNEIVKGKNNLECGLIIVGNGPDQFKIKSLIINLGLVDNVLYFDSIPNNEMSYIYKNCDLFLLPSYYEIYGMVVLEALYNGLPVLASEVAGPIDVLKLDFLGKPMEMVKEDWITYICNILESKYSIDKSYMIKRTNYVKNNYTWENLSEIYLNKVNN